MRSGFRLLRAGGTGSPGRRARSPRPRRAARRRRGSRRGRRTTCRRSPPESRRSATISATASRYSPIDSSAFGGGRRTPCAPAGHVGEFETRGPDAAVAEQAAQLVHPARVHRGARAVRQHDGGGRRLGPGPQQVHGSRLPMRRCSERGAVGRRPIGWHGAYRPVQRRWRRPPFRHRRRRRAGRARGRPDLPGLRHDGRSRQARRREAARAGDPALEGGVRRPQLPGAPPGHGRQRRCAREPADLPQAQHRGDRAGRRHPDPAGRGAHHPRERARRRHRPHREAGAEGALGGLRVRLHLRQRRLGTRPDVRRRPVGAREGLRHLRADRAVDRDRARSDEPRDLEHGRRRVRGGTATRRI